MATTDAEKANAFARSLLSKFQVAEGSTLCQYWRDKVQATILRQKKDLTPLMEWNPDDATPLPLPFTEVSRVEVKRAASRLKFKAPGEDGILNVFLRQGTDNLFELLANMYNLSLRLGVVPSACKRAKVVMVPKQGKDPHSVASYRPISLLPAMGKLLEGILAKRLRIWLENRRLIPQCQSGFRGVRCTSDHLFRLSQSISNGFNSGLSTVAAMLDVEGAFDTVWHDGLRLKLLRSGLPVITVRWLSDFLRNRRFAVQIGNDYSQWYEMGAGVPQGSPLSPILFILFTADMPVGLDPKISAGVFADDIALWSSSRSLEIAEQRLQAEVNMVVKWCDRWRLRLNPAKCQAIAFSRRRADLKPNVTIHQEAIPVCELVKYLGITFDRKLNWNKHLSAIIDNARLRLNGLRAACRWGFGLSMSTGLVVYCSLIRSIIEYGCPAWISAANYLHIRLQRVQNEALRIVSRSPRETRIEDLHDICGIPRVADRLRSVATEFATKALNQNALVGSLIWHSRGLGAIQRFPTPLRIFEKGLPEGPWYQPTGLDVAAVFCQAAAEDLEEV